jgi:hypothetical protein
VNGPRNLLLVVMFVILAAGFSTASDIYIAQNAAGGNTGADCANAHGASWFNSSANWGSGTGKIGPGTTVHLCGTFTGSAGSTMLTPQGNGSAGNPITILFESGANFTAPYWSTSGAINITGRSYLIIDGGTPCGWTWATGSQGACNGHIQATANGSALTYQNGSRGIAGNNTSNIEIRNLGVYNMYVHSSLSDNGGSSAECLDISGSHLSIHHSKMHDAAWCMTLAFPSTSLDWQVYNNDIYNSDHGIAVAGSAASGTLTQVLLHDNHIHDHANWDTTANTWHHDGIHFYGAQSAATESGDVYNNLFDGTTSNSWNETASVFMEQNANIAQARIFNNVFAQTPPASGGNGSISLTSPNTGAYTIVNNTFSYGGAPCFNVYVYSAVNVTFENNLDNNCFVWFNNSSVAALDYNVYAAITGEPWRWNANYETTFASWKSDSGEGSNSYATSGSAGINSDYSLQSNSPAVGRGANLTSLGIAALNADVMGNSRPASGAWDAGARQYANSSSNPAAPTNLTAVVQ